MNSTGPRRRCKRTVLRNYIDGAGSLFAWPAWGHHIIRESSFAFVRNDLDALRSDWNIVGDDLRRTMRAELSAIEGGTKPSALGLQPTNDAKERK